jgi:macrolide transport system ATP-binding/permease protein
MSAPLIELRGLSRRYIAGDQEVYALRDIDLAINAGEMVALMGASGSGKSTLLNILGCLDTPSAGTYRLGGRETTTLDATELAALRRDRFGFIFQRYNLLPQLTARANAEIPAIYAGVAEDARHRRAQELLTRLGLGERLGHRPSQLSGGQQQRVSIARALMNGGAIILADEPTGALDSRTGREAMDILLELNRLGHTLIIATHDPHVAAYARRIVEIEDGRIVVDRATQGAAALSPPSVATDTEASPALPASRASHSAPWSRFIEAARMAWFALLAHRLRTGLTLLGVVIGIVSVVMMAALGESAQRRIQQELKNVPVNYFEIYPGKFFGDPDAANLQTLVAADADTLRQQSFVLSVSPTLGSSTSMRLGSLNSNVTVNGVHESFFETSGYELDVGRGFSREDILSQKQVVMIDANSRKRFFGAENPIGKIINVGKLPCVVIGVVAKNLTMESPGAANRLVVYMPYTTVGARLVGRSHLDSIVLRFRENMPMEAVQRGIEDILQRRHHVKDFVIFNLEERVRSGRVFTDAMSLLLGAIGLVSLVVGGIGVMNIMLVSVSERAREIGIRMAVGARRSDIQNQFLTEAVAVCLVGGAVGVVISYGLSYLASYFLPKEWELVLSVSAVGAAVASAALTGVIFGYVPARNASRLDPVEALSRD